MNRRHFLRNTSLAAPLAAFPYHAFANGTKKYATDRVKLGPHGVELSRLAMGTGTNGGGGSSNQTKQLGVRGLADLLRAAVDEGITFWDAADQYGSHPHVALALKDTPREKVTILSKTHAGTAKQMRADLDRYRRELNTDYIDILLLHALIDADWPKRKAGVMDVISEAQEKGIVRTHGCSCHTLGA
ncbi:MAG: aldo/keto reductase, partial [bacterium]|nr:aldo/keto reductase [bacterium]